MLNVLWRGAVSDFSGYGEASRRYAIGLQAAGGTQVAVKVSPYYFWQGDPGVLSADTAASLAKMNGVDFSAAPFLCLQHATPDTWNIEFSPACRTHVGMTTFETDGVPAQWQGKLRSMDHIIVFSQFNKEVFEGSGIKRPIHVVPHGVDTDRFKPDAEWLPAIAGLRDRGMFVFGSNFDWSPRKNPGALLKAYFSMFTSKDPVAMVIKTYSYPMSPADSARKIGAEIAGLRKKMGLSDKAAPPVFLITESLSEDQLPGFYSALHCHVLPSRGEGWGLCNSESMASGVVTIATGWSGNLEFMNDSNSLLVRDCPLVDVPAAEAAKRPLYAGHRWADPNIEELGDKMRYAFDNYGKLMGLRDKARADMVEKFTWKRAGEILFDTLLDIASPFGTTG